jgi:tetratricopeptide (TPR) repeat protein
MEPAKVAFEAKRYKEAIRQYDDMAVKYPNSATVRVWRAEATLYRFKLSDGRSQYVQAAADALPFYEAAEDLHDRGCRLPDEAQYYLRMGAAYAHLRKGDANKAVAQLENARKAFPDSAEAAYALARASCLLHEVDDCARYFEETLRIARQLRRPIFLRTHRSMDEWIRRSKTQTELEPLRDDRRYQQIVKAAQSAAD